MSIDMKPIYAAVDQGNPDVMDDLLSTVETQVPQGDKDALLGYCLDQRRPNEAMVALSAGADPDTRLQDGDPVLLRAMSNMDMESVVLLLVSGADPNLPNTLGEVPAHAAARQDVPVALELLGRYGADLDAQNKKGVSPLDVAVEERSVNALRFLVDAGVSYERSDLALLSQDPAPQPASRPSRRMGM